MCGLKDPRQESLPTEVVIMGSKSKYNPASWTLGWWLSVLIFVIMVAILAFVLNLGPILMQIIIMGLTDNTTVIAVFAVFMVIIALVISLIAVGIVLRFYKAKQIIRV